MSAFFLPDKNLTADHHRKCAEKCNQLSGPMLKCLNVKAVGDLPCQHVVHVKCLVGLDVTLVDYISKYFCIECTTNFPNIAKEMEEIVDNARQALESHQSSSKSVPDVISQLNAIISSLQQQLNSVQLMLRTQMDETDVLETKLAEVEAEKRRLNILLSAAQGVRKSHSDTSLPFHSAVDSQSVSQSDTSLNVTSELEARFKKRHSRRPFNSTSVPGSSGSVTFNISQSDSTFHNSSFYTSSVCPDYVSQENKASQIPETTLALVRSSIAKPQPFIGDITKWTLFRTDFVRTSSRGSYRAIEDMDRLRELIQGEARELFITELCDPYAEPLKVLQRLDDFYGVRGNAVRVSLDRVTALWKIDKANDKEQLKSLYIHAKQFVAQCRSNDQPSELSSQAVMYIFESKLPADLLKAWRLWLRENSLIECVDSLIVFLEERIKELNLLPVKQKTASSVHFTNVTGGQGESVGSTSDDRSNKQTKREKRLARIRCFKCPEENHPFFKCPVLIKASDVARLQIVNELHVCVRCLSSTKHIASNCNNKLLSCRVPDCIVQNKHPLLHGHPNELIKRFTSTVICIGDVRFLQSASHYAMVPGDIISQHGHHIPVTIMFDSGSGVSLASMSLFCETSYHSKAVYDLDISHISGHNYSEPAAVLFDLLFKPIGMNKVVHIKDVFAVRYLELPVQSQDADAVKQLYPHLEDIPLPSYSLQSPRVLLGLPHAGYLMQTSHVVGPTMDEPIAALTMLGWTLYGRCVNSLMFQQ